MKHLLPRFSGIFILVFIYSVLSAQNISVYPSYPPTAICDGDQVTLIINTSIIPPNKTLAYYKFYFDWPAANMQGLNTPNQSNPQQYTYIKIPPGNRIGHGEGVTTDSTHYDAGTINYTVYYKPIANFSLAPSSRDTQCLKGSSFCFLDSSKQNPLSPSNPLVSWLWVWGDGGQTNNGNPTICHHYGIPGRTSMVLKVTDDHGCSSTKVNPKGHDLNADSGVFVIGNPIPNFSWTGHMQCFGSDYTFKNLTSLPKANVKSYTWDFGDSTSYSASSPFNSLQNSHYDTISHKYILNGIFDPSLIITNTFGCVDTLRKTPSNTVDNLPGNIVYDTKFTASTSFGDQQISMDSFCAGSNLAQVYFNRSPIPFAQPGAGDFVWNFGDMNDPTNRNLDSMSWNPLHTYSGVGKYFVKLTIKLFSCRDSSMYDTIEVLGPIAKIENASNNSKISNLQKYSCNGSDTVDFVNNSSYYKSNHVKRVWDFDDDFAPLCTAYSVPKNASLVVFTNAEQQYNNSNHFYVLNGTTYAGKMNCRYSNDSLPRHLYTNWDTVYSWYQNGKTFPAGWNTPNISANTQLTITPSKPVPDPFWQAQGRLLNLTSGTLRNKFDSVSYTIPGFGTFKRYGNQLLPNSNITFHEYVFRFTVNRTFTVKLTLTDSLNHASGDPVSCTSQDIVNLAHGKPDAHGMSVTGHQCPGKWAPGNITFNLRANGIGAGTKPSCGQTYIYMNFDSLADRRDGTPLYLDAFTSWGVDNGSAIEPGPGYNITPGGLARNTFYSGYNWNPMPPSPWTGPDGSIIAYHYGGNAGTPPPADEQGFITIGLFLGS